MTATARKPCSQYVIDWVEEMRAHQRQLKHLHESLAAQEMEALLFPAHRERRRTRKRLDGAQ